MRLLRISNVYPAYWQQFYARHPALAREEYAEQLRLLQYDAFAQSDAYSNALRQLGYECQDILTNIVPLQRAWAREQGLSWQAEDFVIRHALEYTRRYQPEVLFLNDQSTFATAWTQQVRAQCPSVRLIIGWSASPVNMEQLRGYDLVLTSTQALVEKYSRAGLPVRLLRFSFDERILQRVQIPNERTIPISFIGSVVKRAEFHQQRSQILEQLLSAVDVTLFSPEFNEPFLKTWLRRMRYDLAHGLRHCGVSEQGVRRLPYLGIGLNFAERPRYKYQDPIGRRCQGLRYGLAMYEALAQSLTTFNSHVELSGEYCGNIRMFEATGMGCCLLTDWKRDLADLFTLDEEVVAYRTADECVEKAHWLLAHPDQARAIGQAAQKRVLHEHTYPHRALVLDTCIREALAALPAGRR